MSKLSAGEQVLLGNRVAAAWQAYGCYEDLDPDTRLPPQQVYDIYRALADELEQATGFAVTCGVLTGRPAL